MKLRKVLAIILSSALAATCIPHGALAMDNAAELISAEEEVSEKEVTEEPAEIENTDPEIKEDGVTETDEVVVKELPTQEDAEVVSDDESADLKTEPESTMDEQENMVTETTVPDEELAVELLDMPEEQAEYITETYGEKVLDTYDISVPEDTQFPVTISFDASVTDDQEVLLYHFTGDEWEEITPDEVDEGLITATFNSLSPVAVVNITEEELTE